MKSIALIDFTDLTGIAITIPFRRRSEIKANAKLIKYLLESQRSQHEV